MKKIFRKIFFGVTGVILVATVGLAVFIVYAEISGHEFKPVSAPARSESGETQESPETGEEQTDESGSEQEPSSEEAVQTEPESASPQESIPPQESEAVPEETPAQSGPPAADEDGVVRVTYILDTKSKLFHSPSCPDVSSISEEDYLSMEAVREDIMGTGFSPCPKCGP